MLDWLNKYSALVQAIASIVSVIVTVILAWVTYMYVHLTRRLAEASDEQLQLLRANASGRINALAGFVRMLRILVSELPADEKNAERMRTAALWSGDNLAEFQRLASEHSRTAGQRAAVTVPSLRWLRERVETIKDLEPDQQVNWEAFPWKEWREHRERASTQLRAIWDGLPAEEAT